MENALTLDSTDFLEYLADDPETEIITMYLEGVKDGRKLLEQVTEINRTKPVHHIKGGIDGGRNQGGSSHTGSLAGGEKVWNAFFKKSGAVNATSLEDMAFLALAFRRLKETKGLRMAVISHGGGIAVSAADACSERVWKCRASPRRQNGSSAL